MARLENLMPELYKSETNSFEADNSSKFNRKEVLGKKRRAWLEDEEEREEQKGSINHVYKSDLSTIPINQVYEPLKNKGAINKVYKPLILKLADLRSNPLKLVLYLYSLAKDENDSCKTRRVRLKEIIHQLDISKDSARTALRFLLKQRIISRIEFKPGRMGWSCYKLSIAIYKEIEEALKKGSINPIKIKNILPYRKGANSSSNLNDKNITTIKTHLPEEWEYIDLSPLVHIGFTTTQLKQLIEKNMPETVQESINQFAFGLENTKKVQEYEHPLNVLMGVLRKGGSWSEPNYESPKNRALRELKEKREAAAKTTEKEMKEIYDIEFDIWFKTLSSDQIREILPASLPRIREQMFMTNGDYNFGVIMPFLKKQFEKEIWDRKKQVLLKGILDFNE